MTLNTNNHENAESSVCESIRATCRYTGAYHDPRTPNLVVLTTQPTIPSVNRQKKHFHALVQDRSSSEPVPEYHAMEGAQMGLQEGWGRSGTKREEGSDIRSKIVIGPGMS